MPITLMDLHRNTRTAALEYDGETVEVEYRPSEYTPEVEDAMQQARRSGRPAMSRVEVLDKMLISWDVLDEESKPLVPTRELLLSLPTAFLSAVLSAITEDQRVEREDRKNSGGGSGRRANSGNARNGTR
jgi:hypothetical protein